MKEVTAVDIRRSLGDIARALEADGEPILLKLGRRPVGVIVSLKDFHERFVLEQARDERKRLVAEILSDRRPGEGDVQAAMDELRTR